MPSFLRRMWLNRCQARLTGRPARPRQRKGPIGQPIEALEDRTVPAYLFVDFGDNFPAGTLTTTTGALRDVANDAVPGNRILGPELLDSTIASTQVFNGAQSLNIIRQPFNAASRAQMLANVTRAYAGLNVTIVELTAASAAVSQQGGGDTRNVAGAASMADVVNTLRAGDPASKDCYVFIGKFVVATGTANAITYDGTNYFGGTSPVSGLDTSDLNSGSNLHDDVAIMCNGDGQFNFNTMNGIAHEAGHCFGLQHAITSSTVGSATGSAAVDLLHKSEIMSYEGVNSTSSSIAFTRFPMIRGDGNTPSDGVLNNYNSLQARTGDSTPFDQLATDANVGISPAYTFVSGTGAFDVITITKSSGTTATVSVTAYGTAALTTPITLPGLGGTTYTYTIPLTKTILVYGGDSNDRFIIDGDLGVNVIVDGMNGTDSLRVVGKGAANATYTPNPTAPAGVDNSTTFGLNPVISFGGAIAIGGSTISFSDFELGGRIEIDNVGTVTFAGSTGTDLVTSDRSGGATRVTGTASGTGIVPLFATNFTGLIVNALGGTDTLTADYTAGVLPPITYDGGTGTNTLAVKGTFQTETATFTTTGPGNSGTLALNDGVNPVENISYTNTTTVDLTLTTTANLVFNLPTGVTSASLQDATGSNSTALANTGGTAFATTNFSNPTNLLTVKTGSAGDTLTVAAAPDLSSNLALGSAANPLSTLTFTGAVTLAAGKNLTGNASGNISVNAGASVGTTTGSLTLTTGSSVSIAGTVSSTSGPINVTAAGAITESGAGRFATTGGTLTTSSVTGTTLGGNTNAVSVFNATNSTSGDIRLTNSTALSVTGITLSGPGTVNVVTNGSNVPLTVNGSVTRSDVTGNAQAVVLQATGDLIIAANQTVTSGSGLLLGADLTAAGAGDDGTGKLTINAGATVTGTDITLRGADEDIASTANVGSSATTLGVTVRSSVASRPMSLGGTNNSAVVGVNLTSAELARIVTAPTGAVTIGDNTQTGNITFSGAITATTAGAATNVVQSTAGPGRINFDTSNGTALDGNGGRVTLTPGTGQLSGTMSATNPMIASNGFNATGLTFNLVLPFASTFGQQITLINNTGTAIVGQFTNLVSPGGVATVFFAGLPHYFTISYTGGSGQSLVLTDKPVTITTVTTSAATSVYGQRVTFQATVTPSSGTIATTGSVEFFDETMGVSLGAGAFTSSSGPISFWSYTTTPTQLRVTTAPAAHVIRAVYTGTGTFADSFGTLVGGETITPLPLTASGVTANGKVYDSTLAATLNTSVVNPVGVLSGDTVTVNTAGATGTFASKNVGVNVPVAVAGLTLAGAQAINYSLIQPTTIANISPFALTASGVVANNKVYDSNNSVTLNTTGAAPVGVFASDVGMVTINGSGGIGVFANKNVGVGIPITIVGLGLSGPQAGNYTLTQPTATANITPFAITVTGVTANKGYDTTTVAPLNITGATPVGVYSGDTVVLSKVGATGTFATPNIGTSIAVTVTGLSFTGAQGANYSVIQPTFTGSISPAALTVSGITAANKMFNSSSAATLNTSGATLVGILPGDVVALNTAGATGSFASKGPGAGIPVNVSGLTITGANAANYTLVQPTTTANISAATPNLFAVGSSTGGLISVYNASGPLVENAAPYANFKGGIAVAVGDLNGDGAFDLAMVIASGGPAQVKAFDGATGRQLLDFMAFPASYTGGASIALGDLDGTGKAQIVIGASTGVSMVAVFDGQTGAQRAMFEAYPGAPVGVNVAVGQLDGSGKAQIITAPTGIAPLVRVFNANGTQVREFFAGDPTFAGGISVSAGNLNGSGPDQILIGANVVGTDFVLTFDGNGTMRNTVRLPFAPSTTAVGGLGAQNASTAPPETTVFSLNGQPVLLFGVDTTLGGFDGSTLGLIGSLTLFPRTFGSLYVG